jgi:hypothetical protein
MSPAQSALACSLILLVGCEVAGEGPFGECGGTLDAYCGTNDCVMTWDDAQAKAATDTGGDLYGCEEEAMLMAHGYMMGRTHYYDAASGELQAVVEWSDIEEYCMDSSFTQTWGEQPACTWACTYEEELVSSHYPMCEEG